MAEKMTFFEGYLEAAEEWETLAERGLFVLGVVQYGLRGIEPTFDDPGCRMAFKVIKPFIDKLKRQSEYKQDYRARTVNGQSTDSQRTRSGLNRTEQNKKQNNNTAQSAQVDDGFSFDDFWKIYAFKETVNGKPPRTVLTDKKKAEAVFKRLSKAEKEAIEASIPKYHAFLRATGEYQKNALTFLNGRNWEDDFTLPETARTDTGQQAAPQGGDFDKWLEMSQPQRRAVNG